MGSGRLSPGACCPWHAPLGLDRSRFTDCPDPLVTMVVPTGPERPGPAHSAQARAATARRTARAKGVRGTDFSLRARPLRAGLEPALSCLVEIRATGPCRNSGAGYLARHW